MRCLAPHILVLVILAGSASSALSRAKTDVVEVLNSDHVTCEIKELARGMLRVKTDDMGTIDIKWRKVLSLKSDFYFRVEDAEGHRYFGRLQLEEGESLRVIGIDEIAQIDRLNVVEIVPIERSFWDQFDGSLSLGFSFTKASDVAQLTIDWANVYRTERNLVDTKATTIITDKGSEDETAKKADLTVAYYRLLRQKWTGLASVALQRNDELALARRLIFGLGTGVSPIKSNRMALIVSAGLALNSELATDSAQTTQSVEGVLAAYYSFFKYDSPKSDLTTNFSYFPSLTEADRYRVDFEIKLRHELIRNFYIDLSYYINFDSQAPSGQGQKRDYGIVTSVSWSY